MSFDIIRFLQKLIAKKSVTPNDCGAIALVADELESIGFKTEIFELGDKSQPIKNLYAKFDRGGKNLCFAGHTDVVPTGGEAKEKWRHPPFSGTVEDDVIYGRGAVDMKGAIACFIAAVAKFLHEQQNSSTPFCISLLITGDEEGEAKFGTKALLEHVSDKIDYCIVGEPTSEKHVADAIKIGRRGCINGDLLVRGKQGHAAYPELAHNPIHEIVKILHKFVQHNFADASEHFPATTLTITSADVGNATTNLIPDEASAKFNIRTSNLTSLKDVRIILEDYINSYTMNYDLKLHASGDSFLSNPTTLLQDVIDAIKQHTGKAPQITTKGGTSDARFIKDYCDQIVELGLKNDTAHHVNECAAINDLALLQNIYYSILCNTFIKT